MLSHKCQLTILFLKKNKTIDILYIINEVI